MAFKPQLADKLNMVVDASATPPDFDALDMRAGDDPLFIPAPSFDPSASNPVTTTNVVLPLLQDWNPALTNLILQVSNNGSDWSTATTLDPYVPDPDVTTKNNVTFSTLTNAITASQTIQKNGGAVDTWDSGGTTDEFIPRYQRYGRAGFFEVRVGPVDQRKAFGVTLGSQKTIDHRNDLDWSIQFTEAERAQVYMGTSLMYDSGSAFWSSVDYFQIEIDENDLVFKKNDVEFYRAVNVLTLDSFPMYGGYAFYTADAQLQFCTVTGNNTAASRYAYATSFADVDVLEGNRYYYRFQVDTDTVTDQNGPSFDDYTDAIIDVDDITDGDGNSIDNAIVIAIDESDLDSTPAKNAEGQEHTDLRVWTNRSDVSGQSNIRVPGNLGGMSILYIKTGKAGGIKGGVVAQE